MTAVEVAKVSLSSPLVVVASCLEDSSQRPGPHGEINSQCIFFLSLEDAKMNKIDPGSRGTSGPQGHCCCEKGTR